MTLSPEQLSGNYQACYQLTAELLVHKMNGRGYHPDPLHPEFTDLVQSVLGHEPVAQLIQHTEFSRRRYQPQLLRSIDQVKKELFPDLGKHRFTRLLPGQPAPMEPGDDEPTEDTSSFQPNEKIILHFLRRHLPEADYDYFRHTLLPNLPGGLAVLRKNFSDFAHFKRKANIQSAAQKIKLFRRFFPNGVLPDWQKLNTKSRLGEQDITNLYLLIYLEIESKFPPHFLRKNGRRRAAILTRFLIENLLNTTPEAILREKDELFFVRHKLQNVYRYFHYSTNRVLGNAYPEVIPPWLHSRTKSNYWDEEKNRIAAIRWLVEKRFGYRPGAIYRMPLNKKSFAENGLSYMFNRYYNSVPRALRAAYPDLQPWESGNTPSSYWTPEHAAAAVRWLVNKKGWLPEELPHKVREKKFTRKTFSEHGLATLFEKKFHKNIYQAVNTAWPNRFKPWQFGKVPTDYWTDEQNIYDASKWIAEREGYTGQEIVSAIRNRELTFKIFSKYSIGRILRKISRGQIEKMFTPLFWAEHLNFLQEQKLLRKIKQQKTTLRKTNFLYLLLYGFFFHTVLQSSTALDARYERIARRIKRRSVFYGN